MVMKKNILYVVLIFVSVFRLFSESYPFENQKYLFDAYFAPIKGIEPRWKMEFKNGELLLDIPKVPIEVLDPEVGSFTDYSLKEKYSISKYKDFLFLSTSNKKYMVLYCEDKFCILMDCNKVGTFFGGNNKSSYVTEKGQVALFSPVTSNAKYNSVLEENIVDEHIVYNGWSECYLQLQVPWVPADGKNGIGEWIETTYSYGIDELLLVNGFVRADKPDWYYNNARIKTAFIETAEGMWHITLKDTPHPQIIKLPMPTEEEIRVRGKTTENICKNP